MAFLTTGGHQPQLTAGEMLGHALHAGEHQRYLPTE